MATAEPAPVLWRVEQYGGEEVVRVQATQLEDRGESTAAQRRAVLAEWIAFLSSEPTNIVELSFVSRVPQELLDAVAGQPSLHRLVVKWGPYRDLSALSRLPMLEEVRLGGAVRVESVDPLRSIPTLRRLTLSEANQTDASTVLGSLVQLRELCFGNAYPGSDRSVLLPDVRWAASLLQLRTLALPGTRILDPDLTPLLELPHLESLGLPLRRAYRRQVFEFASRSPVFAAVAQAYEQHDAYLSSTRRG